MDVFALRDRLKSEHEEHFESFVQIADDRVRTAVEAALAAGLSWPYPRVGLNPVFKPGGTVDELANSGRSSLAEYSRLLAEAIDANYATVLDPAWG